VTESHAAQSSRAEEWSNTLPSYDTRRLRGMKSERLASCVLPCSGHAEQKSGGAYLLSPMCAFSQPVFDVLRRHARRSRTWPSLLLS